jgi:leucyl aminopeptidase
MTEFVGGPALTEARGPVLALGVYEGRVFSEVDRAFVERLGPWLEPFLDGTGFEAKLGEVTWVPAGDVAGFDRLVLVGLGDEVDADAVRRAAGALGRATLKVSELATTLHLIEVERAPAALAEGFLLGQYRFDRYLSEPEEQGTEVVRLLGAVEDHVEAGQRGVIVAEGVRMARDLVNEPPGGKSPEEIASLAKDFARELGLEVTIYDREQIISEDFGGLAGVSAGAAAEPRLVVVDYRPPDATGFVAFVGKGIVFDSGGLSLKPAKAMETMKTDVAGAAAVLAAVRTIARLEIPVRVLGITPLTENMPGGRALHPGDVVRARNGKTIEVLNTDAEGRLVLADGLALAAEARPDLIVDVATLTGACHVALGDKIAGLWANDSDAAEIVAGAARRAGERVWEMPLPDDYRKNLDSDVADMKNIGGRYGGAINAALLLREFVGDRPWTHLDIAGPARASEAEHYVTKGGTGFGVRTLVAVAEDLAG